MDRYFIALYNNPGNKRHSFFDDIMGKKLGGEAITDMLGFMFSMRGMSLFSWITGCYMPMRKDYQAFYPLLANVQSGPADPGDMLSNICFPPLAPEPADLIFIECDISFFNGRGPG